jgi:phenylacetate-coenzyme A ligase PaaK-like adenylate-forming protein
VRTEHAHPIEGVSRERIEELRIALLRRQLEYLGERSPFYRAKLVEAGVSPDSVQSLADLAKLPITTKDKIRRSLWGTAPLWETISRQTRTSPCSSTPHRAPLVDPLTLTLCVS